MRKKGLEPLRPFGHQLLRLARLPIPPLPQRKHSIASGQNSQAPERLLDQLCVTLSATCLSACRYVALLLVSAQHTQLVVTTPWEALHATLHKMRGRRCGQRGILS